MSTSDSRAQSLQGKTGMHCCEYVSYVLTENKTYLNGAKNWLEWGQATTKPSEAKVIVAKNGSHVAYVTNNGTKVWHSSGANGGKPIKSYSFADFVKYVMPEYELRK